MLSLKALNATDSRWAWMSAFQKRGLNVMRSFGVGTQSTLNCHWPLGCADGDSSV